jgi:hypothetical protein
MKTKSILIISNCLREILKHHFEKSFIKNSKTFFMKKIIYLHFWVQTLLFMQLPAMLKIQNMGPVCVGELYVAEILIQLSGIGLFFTNTTVLQEHSVSVLRSAVIINIG